MTPTSLPAFRLTFIASAVLLVAALPAQASATFQGTITANSVVVNSSSPSAYVNGSDGNYSSYSGDAANGNSRVASFSNGRVDQRLVETTLVFHQTVTNPYATAQEVSFSFHIPRSRTLISLGNTYNTPNLLSYTAAASMMGDISWGGNSVWGMSYGLTGSGSVASGGGSINISGPIRSASASGFTIGSLQGDAVQVKTGTGYVYDPITGQYTEEERTGLVGSGYVMSDDYLGVLNLGQLAGNQTIDLTYTLKASSYFEGTYLVGSGSECYGGYGGACSQAGGYDPFGIDFTPAADGSGGIELSFTPAVAAVPEPGSLALLLGGFAAMAWNGRRQLRRPGKNLAVNL